MELSHSLSRVPSTVELRESHSTKKKVNKWKSIPRTNFGHYSSQNLRSGPHWDDWGWDESPLIKSIHFFLAEKTFQNAIFMYRIASFIKCVPFQLESHESLRVVKFPKLWKRVIWHIANWLVFIMVTFEIVSFIALVTRESFGRAISIHLIYLFYSLFAFVYCVALYLKADEFILMLNSHDFIARVSGGKKIYYYLYFLSKD